MQKRWEQGTARIMCLAARITRKAPGISGGRQPSKIVPSAATGSHISEVRGIRFSSASPEGQDQKEILLDLGQEEQPGQGTSTYSALTLHHTVTAGYVVRCH